jgi:spore coat polysaccharide biosynthesis protein SpsF
MAGGLADNKDETTSEITAVIQARMSSSRLPGKILKPLGDQVVLDWVLDAVEKSNTIDKIILATSTDPSDDLIQNYAEQRGVDCFRGSLTDVLGRFVGAVEEFAPSTKAVVRITADCPLLDFEILDLVVQAWLNSQSTDYVSTALIRWLPRGMDAEIVSFETLKKLDAVARDHHRVHVTSYAYSHPEEFSIFGVQTETDYSQFRVTLDTEEDYRLIQAVVSNLNGKVPSLENIVDVLNQHPELVSINAEIMQKQLTEG